MARFLFQASYSPEGIKGVLKDGGTGRRTAVEAAVKSLGKTDVYVIVDGLDNATAAAFSMGVGSTGSLSRLKTTVLMTPEEIDQATKKTMSYRAPGR